MVQILRHIRKMDVYEAGSKIMISDEAIGRTCIRHSCTWAWFLLTVVLRPGTVFLLIYTTLLTQKHSKHSSNVWSHVSQMTCRRFWMLHCFLFALFHWLLYVISWPTFVSYLSTVSGVK